MWRWTLPPVLAMAAILLIVPLNDREFERPDSQIRSSTSRTLRKDLRTRSLSGEVVASSAPSSRPKSVGSPGRLTGRIIDAHTREPVPDVEVRVEDLEDERDDARVGITDDDGTFAFTDLPLDLHWISTRSSTHCAVEDLDVDLSDASHATIEIEVERQPELRGRVVDDAGLPIAGAWIKVDGFDDPWMDTGSIESPVWQTDEAGRFSITVPELDVEVSYSIESEGHERAVVEATAPDSGIVVELHRVRTLRITAHDARTGRPLPDFELEMPRGGGGARPLAIYSSPRGDYDVRLVDSGVILVARAPGYVEECLRIDFDAHGWTMLDHRGRVRGSSASTLGGRGARVDLRGSWGGGPDVSVPLDPGSVVEGRIVDGEGVPVEKVVIRRRGPDGRWRPRARSTHEQIDGEWVSTQGPVSVFRRTDANGEFRFEELPSGTLVFEIPSGRIGSDVKSVAEFEVVVGCGTQHRLGDLELERTYSIVGSVSGVEVREIGDEREEWAFGTWAVFDEHAAPDAEVRPIFVDLLDSDRNVIASHELRSATSFYFSGVLRGRYRLRTRIGSLEEPEYLGTSLPVTVKDESLESIEVRFR